MIQEGTVMAFPYNKPGEGFFNAIVIKVFKEDGKTKFIAYDEFGDIVIFHKTRRGKHTIIDRTFSGVHLRYEALKRNK